MLMRGVLCTLIRGIMYANKGHVLCMIVEGVVYANEGSPLDFN